MVEGMSRIVSGLLWWNRRAKDSPYCGSYTSFCLERVRDAQTAPAFDLRE